MPFFPGRAHRLMAVAVAAGCWLAAPAGAQAQQAPALDVSGVTSAATGAVASTGAAVDSGVTAVSPPAGQAQGAVRQAAGTVARVTGPSGPVARVGTSATDATRSVARIETTARDATGSVAARVGTSATDAAGSVAERVTRTAAPLAGVADRAARDAQHAVDSAVHGVTGATRSASADNGAAAAAAASRRIGRLAGPAGGESLRAAWLRLRRVDAAEGPDVAFPGATPSHRGFLTTSPLTPGLATDLPGLVAGHPESLSAGAGPAALEPPSHQEPLSGMAGGSSAAGAALSFSLGGLALLLATLSLAGPALRRRLPRQPVIAWPAAFVPLLERPG